MKGGSVTNTVSKRTTAVIVGKNPGLKFNKAISLKLPIVDKDSLTMLID